MTALDPPAERVYAVTCPGCAKRHLPSGAYQGRVECPCGEWSWYFGWRRATT